MSTSCYAMDERPGAEADAMSRPRTATHKMAGHSRALVALLAGAACLALPAGKAAAEAKHYTLDPVHTRIVFAVDHLGFSKALGTFAHPRGSLWFDPEDWSTAKLDVTIDIASLDLGDADWNKRMLKRDYFDIGKHTEARFVSHTIESTGEGSARVLGDLTLRGETRPLVLDVTLNKHGRHPLTFRTTAGFSATATLRRSDFGMTDNLRTVGDIVELRIEAEAERQRDADGEKDDNPARAVPASIPSATDAKTSPAAPRQEKPA